MYRSSNRGMIPVAFVAIVLSSAVGIAESDPTRPPTIAAAELSKSAETKPSQLTLRAILRSEGRQLAIVNDKRLRVGDRIGSAEIIAINPRSVRMRDSESSFVLALDALEVKKPHDSASDPLVWIGPPAAIEPGAADTAALPSKAEPRTEADLGQERETSSPAWNDDTSTNDVDGGKTE